ncbi:MAG: hypothetical protein DWQ02_25495 [Bacteroidetes bacterium]|nr:MAG: hypothetical protein DWQ02_25495 [Bacteroidota bacterium]
MKLLLSLLVSLLLFQCKQVAEKDQVAQTAPLKENQTALPDSTCTCDTLKAKLNFHSDLTFSNNGRPFDTLVLAPWKNNPDSKKITSLTLIDFDTIPQAMKVFDQVDKVFLQAINHKNVQGLEHLPNLKYLVAEEERFQWDSTTTWIQNLEVIIANKTSIAGLNSFRRIPNLKQILLSFSGFEEFPQDIGFLECLSFVDIGAHTFGSIDLSKINFSQSNCIQEIAFHSWHKNITGLPIGWENIPNVNINHQILL